MIGEVFGRLTVIGLTDERKRGERLWECRCECGAIRLTIGHVLRNGHTKSCGCLARDSAKVVGKYLSDKYAKTHGMTKSPEYKSWNCMWQRCTNQNHKSYAEYKSRKPPESWRSFQQFLLDVGPRPSRKHSLERVENSKPYGPDNTVWAIPAEQHRNMRSNRWIEFGGERMVLTDWAARIGIGSQSLRERLKKWTIDRALTEPKSMKHDNAAIAQIEALKGPTP